MIAYIDPGAGTLVWQMICAAVVGCTFYVIIFFQRIRNLVKHLTSKFTKQP